MQLLTAVIVVCIYAALAVGYVPTLKMNRATIAVTGAALLVLVGAISETQALHSLDMGTILLLGAMMVINVNLRMAGFFRFVTGHTLKLARSPRVLLALAGNFTLPGSAATLIVAELAALKGVKLGFIEFLKAGIPITILTMLAGILWLMLVT